MTRHCWLRHWKGLKHEDWRYVDFRKTSGKAYWLVSFFGFHFFPTVQVFAAMAAAYAAMVVGTRPLGVLDAQVAQVAVDDADSMFGIANGGRPRGTVSERLAIAKERLSMVMQDEVMSTFGRQLDADGAHGQGHLPLRRRKRGLWGDRVPGPPRWDVPRHLGWARLRCALNDLEDGSVVMAPPHAASSAQPQGSVRRVAVRVDRSRKTTPASYIASAATPRRTARSLTYAKLDHCGVRCFQPSSFRRSRPRPPDRR